MKQKKILTSVRFPAKEKLFVPRKKRICKSREEYEENKKCLLIVEKVYELATKTRIEKLLNKSTIGSRESQHKNGM